MMVLQAAGLQEYIPDIGYVSISLVFHIMACKYENAHHPEHSRPRASAQILAVDWILDRFRTAANVRFLLLGHIAFLQRIMILPLTFACRSLGTAIAPLGCSTSCPLKCHTNRRISHFFHSCNCIMQVAVEDVIVEMVAPDGHSAGAHGKHSRDE